MIQHIYAHAKAEGWLHPGDWILDPFAGVSLGAADALPLGYNVLHCELEPRFHALARANLALWAQRYGHLPGYGQAVLLCGDSRRLGQVIQEQGACCVASPPFQASLESKDRAFNACAHPGRTNQCSDYGLSSGQLGNLPPGSVAAAISSPPYADGCAHTGGTDPQPQHVQGGAVHHVAYGTQPGQLGALPTGAVAAVVSSPPYEGCPVDTYGKNPGGGLAGVNSGQVTHQEWKDGTGYGVTEGQIGHTNGTTFWSAAREIVAQVFALLKPGGHAIFVCKNYIRSGAVVQFSRDWATLCEACGFQLIHWHKAMLLEEHGTQEGLFGEPTHYSTARMSFFRRLHTKKYPHLAILWEDVLCFVRG